jgi:diphthamide biosynthesis enzyme Dph1/Dph2-like protein
MERMFIPVTDRTVYSLTNTFIEKLPKSVIIFTSVQYLKSLDNIKKQVEDSGRNVTLYQSVHSKNEGQSLGCDVYLRGEFEGDCFLFLGDGLFHPKALLFSHNKPIHCFNPITQEESILTKKDIDIDEKHRKGALLRFLHSDNVGIVISIKPGQSYFNMVDKLILKYPEKKFTLFVCDTLNFAEFENFPFIQCWVNTLCPRISLEDNQGGIIDCVTALDGKIRSIDEK